jgi:hypothetical protein
LISDKTRSVKISSGPCVSLSLDTACWSVRNRWPPPISIFVRDTKKAKDRVIVGDAQGQHGFVRDSGPSLYLAFCDRFIEAVFEDLDSVNSAEAVKEKFGGHIAPKYR